LQTQSLKASSSAALNIQLHCPSLTHVLSS
jgi:hypothetical protein